MKDSTILTLAGILSHALVLALAVISDSIIPLATFSIIGTALIGFGFRLLCQDK